MAYSDQVMDHYQNPRNVGKFDDEDQSVGTGMVGAPACGDVMRLQIKVNDEGVIEDAKFKTYGCGSAIASSSLLTEWVKGRTLDDAPKLRTQKSPRNWRCLLSRSTALCLLRMPSRQPLTISKRKTTQSEPARHRSSY